MAEALGGAHRVGVIVNPIAGMGGTVALHGTDRGAAALARELGATPIAHDRMLRALVSLRVAHPGALEVIAAAGSMGADSVSAAALTLATVVGDARTSTTADDTRRAAIAIRDAGVDVLLFAGGDGTAADIVDAVGTTVTLLGVPSGVKMHSGVFAHTPDRAGTAAAQYLLAPNPRLTAETEVIDVAPGDEEPSGIGIARVPRRAFSLQGPKIALASNATANIRALGAQFAERMRPDTSYILGPGLTVGSICAALGLAGSRNGFDIVVDGVIVTRDASEDDLFEHLSHHPRSVLVLGVVGGQGFLLGRGNQQISSRILHLIDDEDIVILAAQDKIDALQPPVLHVDLDTSELYATLHGYRRVRTSPTRSTVLRVEN